MTAPVWIMVLHYQAIESTRACLEALRRLEYQPVRVLLTINGSPDGSGQELKDEFPEIEILHLPDNLGFAGGSNAGVRYCIGKGAEWVWLLNNDTEPDPRSLSILMAEAEKQPQAACLGASIFLPGPNGPVRSGAPSIDFRKGKTYERGAVGDDPMSCSWLSGSNLLLRSTAFTQMNGFDESFFLYFEDTDLCHRFVQAGWQCILVPKAHIKHVGGASTKGKLAIWRSYYYTRNRLLFFLRARKGLAAVPILAEVGIHALRHSITLPGRGEDGKRQLRAEMLGLKDYFRGKVGKAEGLDF